MKKLMATTLAVLLALTPAARTPTTVPQPNENQPAMMKEAVNVRNQEQFPLLTHYPGHGAKDNEDCTVGNGAVRTEGHLVGDYRAAS